MTCVDRKGRLEVIILLPGMPFALAVRIKLEFRVSIVLALIILEIIAI